MRCEWLDADLEHDTGVFVQFTGAVTFLSLERLRLLRDVTAIQVQDRTPVLNQPRPLQVEPSLALDNGRGTLQVEL